MSANDKKKYYWLKLDKDFFKSHEIKIVESMPNGKDYILFYLKLLCESTSHEGTLRFSETIPYNDEMLSTITNTNVDIVKSAIKLFINLNMMEIWDDGTLYFNQMSKMIGSETGIAKRIREYRKNQEVTNVLQSNLEIDIEKELDKDIELDNNKKENKKEKNNKNKYGEFGNVALTDDELDKLKERFPNSWEVKIEKLSSYLAQFNKKYKSHYATILNWARNETTQEQPNKSQQSISQEKESQQDDSVDYDTMEEFRKLMGG